LWLTFLQLLLLLFLLLLFLLLLLLFLLLLWLERSRKSPRLQFWWQVMSYLLVAT
jgi:hypothetical protein